MRAGPSTSARPGRRTLVLRWLAVLGALFALAAAPAAARAAGTPDPGRSRSATVRDAHASTVVDSGAPVPARHDHRDLPAGWLPTIALATLAAVAALIAGQRRQPPVGTFRTHFRRRAPPLLRTTS
jgi:hypothetical protein